MKKYKIPHSGNEYYYSTLYSNLLLLSLSMLGAVVYSFAKTFPDMPSTEITAWVVVLIMLFYPLILILISKKISNRIYILWGGAPSENKCRAKLWNFTLQLSIGVFCSFICDFLFSEITSRSVITVFIFLAVVHVGLNGFSKNAVRVANELKS